MRWPEKHFVASEQFQFLYIPIEKVACSALKSWVIELAEGQGAANCVDSNAHIRSRYELQAQPAEVQRRWLHDKRLFRFAFVRNPWDRLVSGFLNKFVPWKSPAQKFAEEHARRLRWSRAINWMSAGWLCSSGKASSQRWREELTFRQFVAELRQRNPCRFDLHWRPQHLFLGTQPLDFLGRFENLEDDFRTLCQKLNFSGNLPEANKTRRDAAVLRNLADAPLSELRSLAGFPGYSWFYTPDLAEQVAELYTEDIRRFGYDLASGQRELAGESERLP
ncbi:MAG: sulfotransferase family 2 domain-containing protein, partial [Pirellulaceae bacterium]|nr:sulfotransferase family 2 domain-containing protein [Pirellulaceae bacterium]